MIVNSGLLGKIPCPILGKSKEYNTKKRIFIREIRQNFALLEMKDDICFFPFKRKEKTKVENKQYIVKK
jgi:hypothetical protein